MTVASAPNAGEVHHVTARGRTGEVAVVVVVVSGESPDIITGCG
ncbi:MAG: hypothetical protein WA708_17720 [Acidobacteriaceae bacterium]